MRSSGGLRLAASLLAISALLIEVGRAGAALTPPGDSLARVAPASGFWLLLFAFALLATDALTRLRLPPLWRIAGVVIAAAALALGATGAGLASSLICRRARVLGSLGSPLLAVLGRGSPQRRRVLFLPIAALALDLVLGFGGMVSFGHAAYLGIGAYTTAILARAGVTDVLVQMALAAVAAAAFAAVT